MVRAVLGTIAVATALVALATNAPPVRAQGIPELSVGLTSDGPGQDRFDEATQSLWIRFSYVDLASATVQITLISPEGVTMYSRDGELTGSGSEAWEVVGDDVARTLGKRASQAAANAQDNARRAATQPRGVAEYLASTSYAVGQVRSSLGLLGDVDLPSAAETPRRQATVAANAMYALLVEAAALPPDDVAGRQALAADMAGPAADLIAAAGALEAQLAATTGLALPPTRSYGIERDAHTVSLKLNGSPSRSTSIWIFDGRLFLPRVMGHAR